MKDNSIAEEQQGQLISMEYQGHLNDQRESDLALQWQLYTSLFHIVLISIIYYLKRTPPGNGFGSPLVYLLGVLIVGNLDVGSEPGPRNSKSWSP